MLNRIQRIILSFFFLSILMIELLDPSTNFVRSKTSHSTQDWSHQGGDESMPQAGHHPTKKLQDVQVCYATEAQPFTMDLQRFENSFVAIDLPLVTHVLPFILFRPPI